MRFYFLTFLAAIAVFVYEKDGEYIVWKERQKLEWQDFQKRPERNSNITALSAIQLRLFSSQKRSKIKWKIECVFIKYKSWAISKTEYVLNHEQKHFDIGEIYARHFRRGIEENDEMGKADNRYKVDSLYKLTVKQLIVRQNEYDSMTNHSNNYDEQIKWDSLIAKELNDLRKYIR